MSIFNKIFGDANEKVISALQKRVDEINNLEEKFQNFSDAEIKEQIEKWQTELLDKELEEQNKILDKILPEVFAIVRETAKRTLKERHYDVQLISGLVLDAGNIAEMKTGEGKTLASTTAIILNALTGRGVHVITVNDYLARRDMVWMGKIYNYLGISVGCLNHDKAYLYNPETEDKLQEVERKDAYLAGITYGTNNEFGFDYLRDNMVQTAEQKVQRDLHYAVIDEVDSVLIDEARTPLIISAPDTEPTEKYKEFNNLVKQLKENEDYNIDEKARTAVLTEEGIIKLEKMMGVENIYTDRGMKEVHHIESALKAQVLFKKDKDYVIKDGEILIVDEFTGRLMPGRRYSEGLHQAIEAKENVEIKRESVTMATITFQNYFRMYKKLSGMTGTAATEAEEFAKIYSLEVVVVPTNKPIIRKDKSDVIFKTEKEKYSAIANEIKERQEKGQPVLVGTISIENNEYLSEILSREGIEHKILNAKQHEKEAEIITQAGQKGAVTIATNMAGRGVDIKLGGTDCSKEEQEEIKKLGGLYVLGTERHESRRIDNQLRGRSGRQGDAGESQFFVSMEDDLMRIFGGEKMKNLMNTLGLPEGMPIENKMISNSIEKAQKKVEGQNFDIRKHLVDYDDVINKQRETIYRRRNNLLGTTDKKQETKNKEVILNYIKDEIEKIVDLHTQVEPWNTEEIIQVVDSIINEKIKIQDLKDVKKIKEKIFEVVETKLNKFCVQVDENEALKNNSSILPSEMVFKSVLLRAIDMLWVEHLDAMDSMRRGVGLSGYAQKDPLVEYKKHAFKMFNELLTNIRQQVVYSIFKVSINSQPVQPQQNSNLNFSGPQKTGQISSTLPSPAKIKDEAGHKVGRNDPCPCGSGKKFKKCCGK